MTEFFREVDEEVRRDRVIEFWKKYRYAIIALGVLVVAGTGAWRAIEHFRVEEADAAGAKYEAAGNCRATASRPRRWRLSRRSPRTAPKGYAEPRPPACRRRDRGQGSRRRRSRPTRRWSPIATSITTSRMSRICAPHGFGSTATIPKEFEQKLRAARRAGLPYRNSIRELLGLAALKRNDFEAAGRWFDAIVADPQAPAGLRQRADAFLGLVQGCEKPAATELTPHPRKNDVHRRDHRPPECRQIDPVQPARRQEARPRRRSSGRDAGPARGRCEARRSRVQDHRHRRSRGRRQRLALGAHARADRSGARTRRRDLLRLRFARRAHARTTVSSPISCAARASP